VPPAPGWPLGPPLRAKEGKFRLNELLGRSVGDRIVADFVVLAVALVTWGALFAYLVRLERSLREIEKK
jgi:hypothetical protein